ncbi:hypothetical protein NDU88_003413 [Pleurodeles waltl]|uniref:Uncharacterized protein n=1 Tax=Pleurodeles waltl TaxID=8319 RepID=A0AAV7TPQ6_PLEWA|nr:hypothetical protein NDU88_003413 [Pleurodeles waltl]
MDGCLIRELRVPAGPQRRQQPPRVREDRWQCPALHCCRPEPPAQQSGGSSPCCGEPTQLRQGKTELGLNRGAEQRPVVKVNTTC